MVGNREIPYTKNQPNLPFASPVTSIELNKPEAVIRLWSEPNYRGRHTTLQGNTKHDISAISAASGELDTRCNGGDGYLHNYYYGQDIDSPETSCDEIGHLCTRDVSGTSLIGTSQLSFTFEPSTAGPGAPE